jgi:hypothetical protein
MNGAAKEGITLAKYLSPREVAELTQRVAAMAKIAVPEVESLSAAIRKRKEQPQYITDGYKQLWFEKHYIAYSTIDDPVVHYAYLTDRHIFEEDHSYQHAAALRGNDTAIPRTICDQFKFALQIMIEDDKNYVIIENI